MEKKTLWLVYTVQWVKHMDIFELIDTAVFTTKDAAEAFIKDMPETGVKRHYKEIPFDWFEIPTTKVKHYV